jgi:two-component system cell cycle sensor histidine kinase/response regulator CckA
MGRLKLPSGVLVAAIYSLLATLLGLAVAGWGGSDLLLYLLIGPVLVASLFYARSIFLTMDLVAAVVSMGVVTTLESRPINSLRTIAAVAGTVLIICEVLHRLMQWRLRTEERLRETGETLGAIVDGAPLAIVTLDREGRVRTWNPAAARIFGWSEAEATGRPPPFVRPGDQSESLALREQVLGGQAFTGMEVRRQRKDGSPIDLRLSTAPLRNARGEIDGVLALIADITDRKQAEERLQHVVRGAQCLLWQAFVEEDEGAFQWRLEVTDPEAAQRFLPLDLAPGQSYGSAWKESILPEDMERLVQESAAALRSGKPGYGHEFRVRRADGSVRWLCEEVRIEPLAATSWRVTGVCTDITDRKRLEEQILQSHKLEAIGQLAGGLAHQFNNLLTVITGYSELLLHRLPPEDQHRGQVEQIRAAAEGGASLTRQILAFGRRQMLAPQVIDLNQVVGDIAEMLDRLIGDNIELAFKADPDLWRVRADPGQVQDVIVNLAVNARDAMRQGGRLTIETRNVELGEEFAGAHDGAEPGPFVMLVVSDTGCGMSNETAARAFEPFFTTKEAGIGSGLGLAVVYGIVKQSGGQIELETGLGRGATFRIYLPRVEAVVDAALTRPGEITRPGESTRPGGDPTAAPTGKTWSAPEGSETVLVVEDAPNVREMVRDVLQGNGYRLLEAGDPEEALAVAGRHDGPIHLLLADVVMPGMSGSELAKRLAGTRPEMRVLYMSGYTEDEVVHHGVFAAEMAFIQKPFTPRVLARKIRSVLAD